jgi:arylsulfatase
MAERPNIVLILADDMGYSDLGCFGGEIRTPNLDRLASEGVRFTHFYNNAVCAPTRASLLTGLYPQQLGLAEKNSEALRGDNNVTLAETLRAAGYRTLMSGKWHNGHAPGLLPVDRGFEKYWGLLSGCSNYFNPGLPRAGEPAPAHKAAGNMRHWGDQARVIQPFTPEDPKFYTTDAFTQKALDFLDECGRGPAPFFLYLAHCAPHFPMQAWPEDIARYRGSYRVGWEQLRRRRYQRQIELGIVDPRWGLSPADERAPQWSSVDAPDAMDLVMSVYAAMIDRLDMGIGRVLDRIRALGQEENTLVLFLSDNGGTAEWIHNTPEVPPGPVNSYHTVDAAWANASNTPFRLYKRFGHEGGISTPLIARWPRALREPGRICPQVGHVVDFMPTFLELAGAEYPREFAGRRVASMEGRSLVAALRGEGAGEARTLFWFHTGARAVRHGKWKLVTQGPARQMGAFGGLKIPAGADRWELYDLEVDRCELRDLSTVRPDVVADLAARWEEWNRKCAAS